MPPTIVTCCCVLGFSRWRFGIGCDGCDTLGIPRAIREKKLIAGRVVESYATVMCHAFEKRAHDYDDLKLDQALMSVNTLGERCQRNQKPSCEAAIDVQTVRRQPPTGAMGMETRREASSKKTHRIWTWGAPSSNPMSFLCGLFCLPRHRGVQNYS